MRIKEVLVLLFIGIFLFGCQQADDISDGQPDVQIPAYDNQVTYDEDVIVPAYLPPDPDPDAEPTPAPSLSPDAILTEHVDAGHLLHGRPDVGDILTSFPRSVNVVFNYPLTHGTWVEVWDKDETTSYGDGDTILADTDNLVAILYFKDMEPGIYKVKYHAVYAGSKEADEDGYYYFKIK